MKTEELNLTIDELNKLCHLYMDCKLSVLEEKELEYILSKTALTSPSIEEVKNLMKIQVLKPQYIVPRKTTFRNWRYISGIAASLAIIFSMGYYFSFSKSSSSLQNDSSVYIAAYSHGNRLSDKKAISATYSAMAKADSLMNLASLIERKNMLKANNIINETLIN